MGGETKYGQIRGGHNGFPLHMGAAETFYSKSGRFVANDASGRGELADANDATLQGFVREGQPANGAGGGGFTTHATVEGDSVFWCVCDLTAVFRMPLAYDADTYDRNYSYALDGELCDIVTITGVQYCNVSASSKDVVRIVGGKASTTAQGVAFAAGMVSEVEGLCMPGGYVDVMLRETKLYAGGVE